MLADKYRVERLLGRGAMGIVVAARHILLDEKFAIKLLHADALSDAECVERFAREARAAAKIKSEHVVRVVDVGSLPSGAPYMVMEHLDGGDLDAWIEQRGPQPIEQAVEFMLQACVAVADAHALGIVHRDLKPSNLFCVRRSDGQLCLKLLDFGISKFAKQGPSAAQVELGEVAPQSSWVMGSPAYMSPEQLAAPGEVDSRSDIWSLGVILHELLAAAAPFDGKTTGELVGAIRTGPTPSIRAQRPDVPAALEEVIATCLAKCPDERYADVGELAGALAPFAPSHALGLVGRTASIVAASKAAAARLPPPPFALSFAAFRATPASAVRTHRANMPVARWRQFGLGLVFVAALALFAGQLWSRGVFSEAPGAEASSVGRAAASVLQAAGRRADPALLPQSHVPPAPLGATPAGVGQPAASHAGVAQEVEAVPEPMRAESDPGHARKPSRPRWRPRSVEPHVRPAQPGSQAQRRAECDPPFYFDRNGNRMFKKECV
ncbi:MAG TPA: protein kinase [Polyangiales bacterium]